MRPLMHPYNRLVHRHKLTSYSCWPTLCRTFLLALCKRCLFPDLTHKTQQDFSFPFQSHSPSFLSISTYLLDSLRLCSRKISSKSISYLFAMTATLPRTSPSSSVKSRLFSVNEPACSSGRSRPISSALIALATSPVSSDRKPIRTKISKSAQPLDL